MFNIGQLVWVWIRGEEPSSALIVKDLGSGFYNVLVNEEVLELSDDRIWTQKDDCIKPHPYFQIKRLFPSLIANQMFTVQPMTGPSALPFYLDYTFGSGSKNEE